MDEKEVRLLEAELLGNYQQIERVYKSILERQPIFRDRVEFLESMAYQLHNLYCAYEQLFETVADFFENQIDSSRHYHADLLRKMELEIRGIRPALLSSITYEWLDELRGFRHFFRHAYRAKLDADRVDRVLQIAIQLRVPFRQNMERFLERLI